MRPQHLFLLLLILGASGCGSSAPEPPATAMDHEAWAALADRGLALAPVAGVQVLASSPDAPSFFADELHISLQAALLGINVAPPDDVFARLEAAGPDAQARMRSLRRRLIREEDLVAAECSGLAQELGERFLFVTFLDEGSEEGLYRMNLDDYQAFEYDMKVHEYSTDELHGIARGFVVDLEEGRWVWRQDIEYLSEGLESAGSASRRLIERTRADAAFRLAEALAGSEHGD